MAGSTTWATALDVQSLTGKVVSDTEILMATAVIEMDSGARIVKLDPALVSERNLEWLKRAVAYQAAFMVDHPDYFSRMDLESLSQDGVSATFKGDMTIAPLAKRCLRRLSWRGMRTLTPSINRTVDRPGYRTSNAPDLPDVASASYTSDDFDDALDWQGMS